jgi:high affinity Mn2+ porin
MRRLASLAAVAVFFVASSARAEVSEATGHRDDAFDFMNLMSDHKLHNLDDESWNAYGQLTYISSWKLAMPARYTNLNGANHSLSTAAERSFTGTFTAYLGARLWPGGEAYYVPEVISLKPLSGLTGLGGAIQNAELQKTGAVTPQIYQSRAYIQQRINLGGKHLEKSSDPMQLSAASDSRRIVIRAGNFSIIDFFDKNIYSGDLRQQFFNMDFLTYAAYDFAADARGYAYGATVDVIWDDWALRIGRMTPPKLPNQEALDFNIGKVYGDQAELEHHHKILDRAGTFRLLAYRNRENMGRFDDAIAAFKANPGVDNAANCGARFNYGSMDANAPDMCWARRPNTKVGIGVSLAQAITSDIGLFFRGMVSDGRSEVYSFVSADRSLSFGVLAKGAEWHRPFDVTGVGYALSWISQEHADYLRLGGVDGFIGDGTINPAAEGVLEAFYSFNLFKAMWLSADYQHIANPAYNADRGPVEVVSARYHAEF